MRSTLGRWLVCGAIGLAALAGPAAAQTLKEAPAVLNKQDAAAQHFQLGVEFYRAGDYAAARVEFEAAFGLSQLPDLLHNLSLTTEKQGQVREAIEYEERFLAAKRGELTTPEIDEARGRLLRLREQQKHGPQTAPTVPAVPAVASPGPARGAEPTALGWRPPAGALALLVGGGAALVAGLVCGGAALATGSQLGSGQAFTLREIDALTRPRQRAERLGHRPRHCGRRRADRGSDLDDRRLAEARPGRSASGDDPRLAHSARRPGQNGLIDRRSS